jgi:hypothetical protein
MNTLMSPTDENILLAAFRALKQKSTATPQEMVTTYGEFFKSSVALPLDKQQVFERFSLSDPNVRLTIKSHTSI